MVGAVLTQATSWGNVEKALANLIKADALYPSAIRDMPVDELACLVYPSGYYNSKARKLKALCWFICDRFDDDLAHMAREPTHTLRPELLEVYGIGDETADDILLYALGHPVFVIDNYTHRMALRMGLVAGRSTYSDLQALYMQTLPLETDLFNEYHALIVRHSVEACKKQPLCADCPVVDLCETGLSGAPATASP